MKIRKQYLDNINNMNNLDIFGSWTSNIEELSNQYKNSKPFSYIKIDNFLDDEIAEKVYQQFPEDYQNWWKYCNPLEVKYANDNINNFPENLKDIFYHLSSNQMIDIFAKITGISKLEYDPYLHGAGIHAHPRYGRLHMHLDYEKHPKLDSKERKLNIILFLTKNWKKEWNGDNQLWNKDVTKCKVRTYPKFNSAIIFQTNDISWHGLPDKILCPKNVYRKSLAYYYISPISSSSNITKFGNDGSGYRTKASFIKIPDSPNLPQLNKLYKIRPNRRITKEDMEEIWPDWTPELY